MTKVSLAGILTTIFFVYSANNTHTLYQKDLYLKPLIEKNGHSSHNPDELDLIRLIAKAVAFIRKFRLILTGFTIAGLLTGLYFYFTTPKQYSSSLIVHSTILTNQEAIEIIETWQGLLAKQEFSTLAHIMNCKEAVVKQISKISAEEIIKLFVQNNPNGFMITVSVKDASILDQLRNGIVYGLDNSPYAKEKIEAERAKLSKLIEQVKTEISKVDETKLAVNEMLKSNSANASPMLVYVARINTEWMELNEKLLWYQEQLKFSNGVQVLSDFTKGKLVHPNPLKFIVFGLATGAFLGYVLSLILYVWRKIAASKDLYQ